MTSGPSVSTRRSNNANVENARCVERDAVLSERVRCHIELDVVHELRVPDGRVERRASLDQRCSAPRANAAHEGPPLYRAALVRSPWRLHPPTPSPATPARAVRRLSSARESARQRPWRRCAPWAASADGGRRPRASAAARGSTSPNRQERIVNQQRFRSDADRVHPRSIVLRTSKRGRRGQRRPRARRRR